MVTVGSQFLFCFVCKGYAYREVGLNLSVV